MILLAAQSDDMHFELLFSLKIRANFLSSLRPRARVSRRIARVSRENLSCEFHASCSGRFDVPTAISRCETLMAAMPTIPGTITCPRSILHRRRVVQRVCSIEFSTAPYTACPRGKGLIETRLRFL